VPGRAGTHSCTLRRPRKELGWDQAAICTNVRAYLVTYRHDPGFVWHKETRSVRIRPCLVSKTFEKNDTVALSFLFEKTLSNHENN
jgi:hypothetical protein